MKITSINRLGIWYSRKLASGHPTHGVWPWRDIPAIILNRLKKIFRRQMTPIEKVKEILRSDVPINDIIVWKGSSMFVYPNHRLWVERWELPSGVTHTITINVPDNVRNSFSARAEIYPETVASIDYRDNHVNIELK